MKDQSGLYKNRPAAKFIPAKASDPSCGDMSGEKNTEHRDFNEGAHDFNYDAKVTNPGETFHHFGKPQSGLTGNFAQKDASIAYLKDRGMKGQEVRNYSGGAVHAKMHTYNGGVTAYNNNPIRETYTPATSHKVPPTDAIKRPVIERSQAQPAPDQKNLTKKAKE